MTEVLFARLDEMTAAVLNLQNQINAIAPIDSPNIIALAALDSSTGLLTQTAAATFTKRQLSAVTNQIAITNPDGVSGNPTIGFASAITLTGINITGGTFFSPTLSTPALGTPASGVATNLTGTAAGLTAGTVTTNANLTGPITSVGNATAVASQTGTGSKFVMDTSPTISGITLTGTTVAPTASANDNTTKIATTAFYVGQAGTANPLINNAVAVGTSLLFARQDHVHPVDTSRQAADAQLFSNVPQQSKSAAYTTVLTDGEKHILHPTADNNARTFTIDSNANVAYPVGTTLTFVNQINVVTIAITTDTLVWAGTGTTGSRTLAANGMATAIKIASTVWFINGVGLT